MLKTYTPEELEKSLMENPKYMEYLKTVAAKEREIWKEWTSKRPGPSKELKEAIMDFARLYHLLMDSAEL